MAAGEALEVVFATVRELNTGQVSGERSRDIGDEDLAAVGDRRHARGDGDRAAEVAGVLGDDAAGVDADTDAERVRRQRRLNRDSALDGRTRAREGEHERV